MMCTARRDTSPTTSKRPPAKLSVPKKGQGQCSFQHSMSGVERRAIELCVQRTVNGQLSPMMESEPTRSKATRRRNRTKQEPIELASLIELDQASSGGKVDVFELESYEICQSPQAPQK